MREKGFFVPISLLKTSYPQIDDEGRRTKRPTTGNSNYRLTSCSSFNPKREARPSQTVSARTGRCNRWSFNPKREARPSQTKIISLEALLKQVVSIPNGKPGPL